MKKLLLCAALFIFAASCGKDDTGTPSKGNGGDLTTYTAQKAEPDGRDGVKRSATTYQLLVYSFADSDGDGMGDFRGIISKLDYIESLGATAIWLSPIHPADSYHGYDVIDYTAVNPDYGTMADFEALVAAAHERGIKIYLDYVLNHTGKSHPWFLEAVKSEDNAFRDHYIFSRDPEADVKAGRIPMLTDRAYNSGEWFDVPTSEENAATRRLKFTLAWGNRPTVTVTDSDTVDAPNPDTSAADAKYLYFGDGECLKFYDKGGSKYELNVDFRSSWGFLVRTSATTWDGGTKFGASSSAGRLALGVPFVLTADSPSAKPWGTASRTLSLGFENGDVKAGQTVTAHMMMMPTNLSSAAVTFYISAEKSDGTPVTYTMTKSGGLNFAASTSYTAEIKSLTAYNTHIPMVYVPGGSLNICGMYVEGLDDYQLLDKDYKVNSFWMSQTEVTNQQYCDFLNSRQPMDFQLTAWIDSETTQIEKVGGKYVPKSGPILQADKTTKIGSYADYPVICVTYNGANAYSAWVAEKMCGYSESNYTIGCYLPSEAQWEYAATGSEWNEEWNELFFAGGNDPEKIMWYCGNCDSEGSCCLGAYMGNAGDPDSVSGSGSLTGGTHPVGRLQPNYLGLYDMSGNVGEICADYFVYDKFPYGGSLDPRCMDINAATTYDGEQLRSVRGGFWFGGALNCITFMRDYVYLTYSSNMTGFRVILPLK